MLKRKNTSKKKVWGFTDFKIIESGNDTVNLYEQIFNLNLEISELYEKLQGSISKEERLKTLDTIEMKKQNIKFLENSIKK